MHSLSTSENKPIPHWFLLTLRQSLHPFGEYLLGVSEKVFFIKMPEIGAITPIYDTHAKGA
jgi:hypothetical protein